MNAEKWQQIETAPKDEYVIVYPPTYRGVTTCAVWDDDKYSKRPRPYWRRIDTEMVTVCRDNPPTHWRPVLKGPENGEF